MSSCLTLTSCKFTRKIFTIICFRTSAEKRNISGTLRQWCVYSEIALETLNLGFNEIHSLDKDLFKYTPNLTRLYLNNNPIEILDHVTVLALSRAIRLEVNADHRSHSGCTYLIPQPYISRGLSELLYDLRDCKVFIINDDDVYIVNLVGKQDNYVNKQTRVSL